MAFPKFKLDYFSLILVILLLIVPVFGVRIFAVYAQDSSGSAQGITPSPSPTEEPFNFQKAYKDYIFNSDVYNKAHSDYLLARAQYFQAKTLASQTKAQEATAKMLISRDDVLITYLLAIRQRVVEAEGIDPITTSGLTGRIDSDVLWFRNHKSKIDSAASLDDLTADSTEALKHYPTTEALSYEALSNIPLGKEFVLRSSLNDILSTTKNVISRIRSNGDHDTTNAERWTLETNNKLTRSLDKEVDAQKSFPLLQDVSSKTKKSETYTTVIAKLNESLQYLKEAASYMREVIKSLKTKQ